MTDSEFSQLVNSLAPKSKTLRDCCSAFWTGGLICCLGQLLMMLYHSIPLDEQAAATATSISLILLSAILTGLAVYDDIAKLAGAGTLVPITGFANSVCATAIEYQPEGQVYGVGVKIFTIAGPVILYGIFSSWLLGLLYWCGKILGLA